MLDLIVVGTIAIDLYYKGEALTHTNDRFELAIGGKYFVDHFYEGLGGGGANVAIGAIKQSCTTALVANIGENAFTSMIREKLQKERVAHEGYCQAEKEYVNISSVLLNKQGEKTIINYRTPHQHIFLKDEDRKILLDAPAMYMANLSQVSLQERVDILHYAKSQDRQVFANLNVTDCRRHIEELFHFIRYVDVLVINSHEFADMVKTHYEAIDFHHDVTAKYAPFQSDKVLVVTDGQKGSYAYHNHKVYYQKAIPDVQVVDTTGAGDGFTSGFIVEYLKSRDIQKALHQGAVYATHILAKIGSN